MLTLTIARLRFVNTPLLIPITVSLYIKEYYAASFTLIDSGVNVDVNGNVMESPLPTTLIDPTHKYVLRAVNELCGDVYDQDVIINPYCPPGYALSSDDSFCFFTEEVAATPPSASENAVSGTNVFYSIYGSVIFDPGYNIDGVGSFTQISYANPFWLNGIGYPSTVTGNTADGPQNRSGIWSPTIMVPQDIGFSVCVTVPVDSVYYIGLGSDDRGIIKIDGTTVVQQNLTSLYNYFAAHGYPLADLSSMGFRFWYIYPVALTAGTHTLEILGHNSVGTAPGSASIGCEVYNLTSAQIQAATSYGSMGTGLVFSSKNFVGLPIQIGTDGIGYSCPAGFSLRYCESPIVCVRVLTTPILY